MRKKPDILLMLTMLVVSGVVLSQFVISFQAERTIYNSVSVEESINSQSNKDLTTFSPLFLKQHQLELVRIDPLRQQTH